MAYTPETWLDRNVEHPTYYTLTEIGGGVYALVPAPGTVTEAGTIVTAARMNNIESGIIKSIKTGTISGGGTIPQTAGYTNYVYFVSPNAMTYGDNVSGGYATHPIVCSVDQSTRVVTCYSEGLDYSTPHTYTGTANYIEIAW
ncbi:MAG: hypothetical protein WA125_17035 [Desulfosporosinus sp.]